MKAIRPRVDAQVLGLLRTHTFAARDFFETRQGVCRVLPPLTHRLAETAPAWATAMAPVAEGIARALFQPAGRAAKRDRAMPTPLTEANRSAGREGVQRRPRRPAPSAVADLPPACRGCGVVLDDPGRAYCDGYLPERREEAVAVFATVGPRALARRRAEGTDPAHGGEAARKRGRTNAGHVRANAEWERSRRPVLDQTDFTRDVLPRLRDVPLSKLMEATRLSLRYCSLIRRGRKVPHQRHWIALERLRAPGRAESSTG